MRDWQACLKVLVSSSSSNYFRYGLYVLVGLRSGQKERINLSLSHRRSINLTTWRSTRDHQQPKNLRAGLGWCLASVPLPSGFNTGSNPGEGRVLNKKTKKKLGLINICTKMHFLCSKFHLNVFKEGLACFNISVTSGIICSWQYLQL